MVETQQSIQPDPRENVLGRLRSTPLTETYTEDDIFDGRLLFKEYKDVTRALKDSQDSLSGLQIRARSSSSKATHDYQSWCQIQKKPWGVLEYLATLDEPYAARVASTRAGAEPITMGDFCHYQILHMGGELLIKEILRQELFYTVRHEFADRFEPYVKLQEFAFGVSRMNIRIGGVSLRDVFDTDQRKDGSAVQYRFLVDSTLVAYKRTHESVFRENQRDPFGRYPNMTKYMVETLVAAVRAGLVSSPDVVDGEIRNNSGIPKEVAQYGKRYVQ